MAHPAAEGGTGPICRADCIPPMVDAMGVVDNVVLNAATVSCDDIADRTAPSLRTGSRPVVSPRRRPVRTSTLLPGRDPSPARARARRMISMWSAAVFAPALPGLMHSTRSGKRITTP